MQRVSGGFNNQDTRGFFWFRCLSPTFNCGNFLGLNGHPSSQNGERKREKEIYRIAIATVIGFWLLRRGAGPKLGVSGASLVYLVPTLGLS